MLCAGNRRSKPSGSKGKTKIYWYVPLSQVAERLEQGWTIVSELGPPHCFYSVLMEEPQKQRNFFSRAVEFVLAKLRIGNTKNRSERDRDTEF